MGPLPEHCEFSVIEIPDGWGSQADVTSILQTAAAFKDADQMYQLHHVGMNEFDHLMGDFFQEHRDSGATPEDFGRFLESSSKGQLKPVVQNWIFGSTYAQQIQSAQS